MLSAGQHTAFIMVPAFLLDMESAKKAKAAKVAKLLWRLVLFRRDDSGYISGLKVLGCHNAFAMQILIAGFICFKRGQSGC